VSAGLVEDATSEKELFHLMDRRKVTLILTLTLTLTLIVSSHGSIDER